MPLILPEPPKHVCVLRLSAIGDTCHTLPVIRALQAHWPQTQITWVIGKSEASLMHGLDGIKLVEFDKRGGWRAFRELRQALAGTHYDVLLQMQIALRASVLSRMIHAKHRVGFDRVRARNVQWLFTNHKIAAKPCQHVMDGLFGFSDYLGVSRGKLRWNIPLSARDKEFAGSIVDAQRPTLLISPCSSQRARNFRNWPVADYLQVARHAIDIWDAQIILTGGPSAIEQEYAAGLSKPLGKHLVNLVGKTSLKQLLAVIAQAQVVLCPDSGPAHMATAVGTPVIGLYASTNPKRSGPYNSLQWTIDKYAEAVKQEFGKTIAEIKWGQRVRDPKVMAHIQVGDVVAKLDELFDNQQYKKLAHELGSL